MKANFKMECPKDLRGRSNFFQIWVQRIVDTTIEKSGVYSVVIERYSKDDGEVLDVQHVFTNQNDHSFNTLQDILHFIKNDVLKLENDVDKYAAWIQLHNSISGYLMKKGEPPIIKAGRN